MLQQQWMSVLCLNPRGPRMEGSEADLSDKIRKGKPDMHDYSTVLL